MKRQLVIGLEIHARLKTRSKLFSGAVTGYGAAPSTQACAVDVALPGVLPAGFDDGLPVGMQLIGNHFSEASLLALGHRYQRETDRHRRVPPAFGQ